MFYCVLNNNTFKLFLFKTDKVALYNSVEWNDETEWLYLKLYVLYKCKCNV